MITWLRVMSPYPTERVSVKYKCSAGFELSSKMNRGRVNL